MVFLFRKLSLTILCVNAAELQSKDCPPSKDSASFSTNNNQPQCIKADNFFAPISATRMGNKKEQTLLNRFRPEERLFENTLKSLQQNVLDNQPVPVLRTILRNLSYDTSNWQILLSSLQVSSSTTLWKLFSTVCLESQVSSRTLNCKFLSKKQTIIYQSEAAVSPAASFNKTSVTNILTSHRYHLHWVSHNSYRRYPWIKQQVLYFPQPHASSNQ